MLKTGGFIVTESIHGYVSIPEQNNTLTKIKGIICYHLQKRNNLISQS